MGLHDFYGIAHLKDVIINMLKHSTACSSFARVDWAFDPTGFHLVSEQQKTLLSIQTIEQILHTEAELCFEYSTLFPSLSPLLFYVSAAIAELLFDLNEHHNPRPACFWAKHVFHLCRAI